MVASVSWAGEALTGWEQVAWVPTVVAILVWRRLWSPRAERRARKATAVALRRHEDPGADLREATALHACQALARPTWQVRGLALLLVVLAVGCASAGWLRDDGWDAAPAPFALAVALGVVVVDRVTRTRARRWLDDPAYAVVAPRP